MNVGGLENVEGNGWMGIIGEEGRRGGLGEIVEDRGKGDGRIEFVREIDKEMRMLEVFEVGCGGREVVV